MTDPICRMTIIKQSNRRGGLVVRASASCAGVRGSDHFEVFKTGGNGFPPWRSGLRE